MRIFSILLATTILLNSCYLFDNDTKEQYLQDYDVFITDFSEQHHLYSTVDWQAASEKMNELTNDRYYQFESMFNYREKLVLNKWAIMFALARYKSLAHQRVSEEYAGDSETLLNGLREIMDSTYTIYDGFDENMRQILFKMKPCD